MTRTPPALPALVLLLAALAGCQDAPEPTRIVLDFPEPRADVDTTVPARDAPTAAAQLEAWSAASGVPVELAQFSFGRCLDAIDGVPTPGGCQPGANAYWALAVNGEPATAGMDDVPLAAGDVVTWTYTPLGNASGGGDAPALNVDPPAPTREDMVMLTGTLDRAARLGVAGLPPVDAAAGPWMLHVPLDVGRTPLLVTADDGRSTAQQQVVAVRLASATFQARFTMAVPPHAAIDDLVWYDPDELASAPSYTGTSAQHSGTPIVHDLMVAWERQSGKAITYSPPASFGFGVERIDGVGQPLTSSAPPYWCFKVNGVSPDVGISLQPLAPGDVVAWEYGSCT